jgi:hypothetical protein
MKFTVYHNLPPDIIEDEYSHDIGEFIKTVVVRKIKRLKCLSPVMELTKSPGNYMDSPCLTIFIDLPESDNWTLKDAPKNLANFINNSIDSLEFKPSIHASNIPESIYTDQNNPNKISMRLYGVVGFFG